MDVLFRTDASFDIGSGHVMRCLVLAEEMRCSGFKVKFATRSLNGNLIQYIQSKGFDLVQLKAPEITSVPKGSSDYTSWLQVPWLDDALEVIDNVNKVDLVVVDHYGLDESWEAKIRGSLSCKILVIDDLNRNHIAESFILDQNLWPNMNARYNSAPHRLLGPSYALLRCDFKELRNKSIEKNNQLLVFFGGSDPTGECQKVIDAIKLIDPLPFKVKIVTGALSKVKVNTNGIINNNVEIVEFIESFEYEIKKSNYAFGASGVSNWERFCLELPSTVVSVASNQEELSEYLFELGAVRYLGSGNSTSVDTYVAELNFLSANWGMIDNSQIIKVDGLGSTRVVEFIKDII